MTTKLRIPEFDLVVDGETYKAETATVNSFHLGYEDHGIFTAEVSFLGVDGGWGQGLPAMGFDRHVKGGKRMGTEFGMTYIMRLVEVIGSPEQAKGRRVIVLRKSSFDGIKGVASLADDGSIGTPFMFEALSKQYYPG